jgi:hypothetical protein
MGKLCKFYIRIFVCVIFIFIRLTIHTQCHNSLRYPLYSIDGNYNTIGDTIAYNQKPGQYFVMKNLVSGTSPNFHVYKFSSSNSTDYFTIRDAINPSIIYKHGPTPITFYSLNSNLDSIQVHINSNNSCSSLPSVNRLTVWSSTDPCSTPGDTIKLVTQSEVNSFIASNCAHFDDVIVINDNDDGIDNITTLTSLQSLTYARSLIIESNGSLVNLNGLSDLNFVSRLIIKNNPVLTNIDGLSGLDSSGVFNILDNPALINLNKLTSLKSILGFLDISNNASLTNLDGLANLTKINGNLVISKNNSLVNIDNFSSLSSTGPLFIFLNSNLVSLSGFNSLTTVNGLNISNNTSLTHINGFNLLDSIKGSFSIILNPNLTSITGFTKLSSILLDLGILKNANLTSLEGFSQLNSTKSLTISENPSLKNINGFKSLIAINGSMTITLNGELLNINGFSNLYYIIENLTISNNSKLKNIDGLLLLAAMGGNFTIMENDSLKSIKSFGSISSIDGDLRIKNNPSLSLCCGVYPVLNANNIGDTIEISSNIGGCNSKMEVITNGICTPSFLNTSTSGTFITLQSAINAASTSTANTIQLLTDAIESYITIDRDIIIKTGQYKLQIEDQSLTVQAGKILRIIP